MINNQIYKVIGKIERLNPSSKHCEAKPLVIFDEVANCYTKISATETTEIFLPEGKIFIPEIANQFNNNDIIEFYTREPIEKNIYEHKHIYSIDSRKQITVLFPKVIMIEALSINSETCEYDLVDSSLDIENNDLYVYDKKKNILYEKIKYNKAIGIRAAKGKSLKGISYNLLFDENFISKRGPFIYLTDDFIPDFSEKNEKFTLDLATRQQKLECFKKTLFELNNFENKDIQSIGYLLNKIKNINFSNLPTIIEQRNMFSIKNLELIKITDEEIKKIISSSSNLGTFLIEKTKQEYQSEFEKITTLKINQLKNELEQLNTEIKSKQNEIIELTNQTQKLNKTKNNMEKETTTLINNKEIIYETIKAIMKCNITNNENQFIKPNIYTENADLPENDFLDSEFEFSLVNKNTKSILINKFSLVPSVSYVYTIANALGNSKVLNLSVEYDWLHYSDFVKHGLLDFIVDSHNNTDTFYFINFDNINIIPMECGFSSIFKVFNREKPYFEGTTQKMPNNLFITATILPTKKETNIGHPLPSNLKTIFKGIDNPNNIEPLNFTSVKKDREFKYLFSKKLINDLLKKTADNLENICSPDTMSDYYEY